MIDETALADAELRGAFAAQKEARRIAEQFLGIFDDHLPLRVLTERLCAEATRERESRQAWAQEAARLEAALADAAAGLSKMLHVLTPEQDDPQFDHYYARAVVALEAPFRDDGATS
jgi:hypothetical protein